MAQRVMIVALPGCMASAVVGLCDALALANQWCVQGGLAPVFSTRIVSQEAGPVDGFGGYTLLAEKISLRSQPAVVIVPPVVLELEATLFQSGPTLAWLKRCAEKGSVVASVCTGAFFLAEAGLLEGHVATTNPMMAEAFRKRYPAVQLSIERRLTERGDVLCAGSTTAFLDLAVRLVERFVGHEIAVLTAKSLVVDKNAASQLPYVLPMSEKAHDDADILMLQLWLEQNFVEAGALEHLRQKAKMSARSLNRRFKQATGETPVAYLHKVRVEAAKRLLETTRSSVSEITGAVGYEDERSFRRLFVRFAGLSPREYRRRFAERRF